MENETTKAEVVIEKATEITEQPVINEKLIEELSAELRFHEVVHDDQVMMLHIIIIKTF
jgi:hypothetical protein